MHIGIIRTGAPPADLTDEFGQYPGMIERLLGPSFNFTTIAADDREFSPPNDLFDGFIVTGSSSAVYGSDIWIGRLLKWLRHSDVTKPLVGLCFGHQALAVAFGGRVERSEKGWGWGLHTYDLCERPNWLPGDRPITLPAAHEDQVIVPGERGRVVASSTFCPIAVVEYEGRRAMSVQAHPEFSVDFEAALIRRRLRNGRMSKGEADAALESLKRPNDCSRFAEGIGRFIRS